MMEELMKRLQNAVPINIVKYAFGGKKAGLVIVDEINGFCKPGCGPLAPPAPDKAIGRMIAETDSLANDFLTANRPVLVFLDTHKADVPEPPYPAHCIEGTEQAQIVEQLRYLVENPKVTVIRKDCINGFIGAFDESLVSSFGLFGNKFTKWVYDNEIEVLVFVGICTDICDMDVVLTGLSARNHGMMRSLKDIVVYEPGCATYDLPKEVAVNIGLPESAAHPRELTHYMGLYFMASRGAILANQLSE